MRLLTDERLNCAETWRNLRILQRGHTTTEAESLRALYEQIVEAEGAAFLLCQDDVSEELKTELMSFCVECALPIGLDYLQATDCPNMLGAYETALEEAGARTLRLRAERNTQTMRSRWKNCSKTARSARRF